MAETPNIISKIHESISRGVQVAHDGFTYKVAAIATIPIVAVILAATLALKDRLVYVSSGSGLTQAIRADDGWGWVLLITIAAAWTWAVIAVTIRFCRGKGKTTVGIFEAALARLPFVIVGWLSLFLVGVVLWAITWLLTEISGVVVVAVLVAILSIPMVIAWASLFLVAILAVIYLPVMAGVDETAGPGDLLKRTVGFLLARPVPSILTPALAGFIASLIGFFFVNAALLAIGFGLVPPADQMLMEGRTFEANLMAVIGLALVVILCWVPWGIAVGALADYVKQLKGDAAVERAPGLAVTLLTNNRLFGRKAVSPAPPVK